jgi:hypothetical protein
MPLEHLMQDNPIEEPPEAQPEQNTGSDRKVALLTRMVVHSFSFYPMRTTKMKYDISA